MAVVPYVPASFTGAQTAAYLKSKKAVPKTYVPGGFGQGLGGPQQIHDYLGGLPTITVPRTTTGTDTTGGSAPPSNAPFDYVAALKGDYLFPGIQSAFDTTTGASRDQLREMIRNAVIQGGFDIRGKLPGDLSEYAGDIDSATLAAASANPLSGRALLSDALGRGQRDLSYDLAGKGTLRSGALEAGNEGLLQQYDVNSNTQLQDLLTSLRGGVGQYRDVLNQAESQRQTALASIAARLAQQQGGTLDNGDGSNGLPAQAWGLPSGVTLPDMDTSGLADWKPPTQAQLVKAMRNAKARAY